MSGNWVLGGLCRGLSTVFEGERTGSYGVSAGSVDGSGRLKRGGRKLGWQRDGRRPRGLSVEDPFCVEPRISRSLILQFALWFDLCKAEWLRWARSTGKGGDFNPTGVAERAHDSFTTIS